MMFDNIFRAFAFVCLLASSINSQSSLSLTTYASGPQDFVTTSTSAKLTTEFDPAFNFVDFSLVVSHGVGVTQAHYHCAAAGVSGPIVAFLYGFNAAGVNVNGLLSRGRLYNQNILNNTDFATTPVCGVTINNIASLYTAIKQDLIYLNVHTIANPGGEVRGQVLF
jgi:hypothetical protein